MAKIADRAGVSRQTVYNEFGTKQQMAEQLIMRELETFLAIVRERFEAESEFVPAVRAGTRSARRATSTTISATSWCCCGFPRGRCC